MWTETRLDIPKAEPLPPVPKNPHQVLAEHFGVLPETLWCGPIERIFDALPPGRIALAEPCAPEITRLTVASGRRYVNAGRDVHFAIHPSGWRYALALPEIDTAWLMFPNEPLSRAPVSARVQEAVAANAFIVFDGRYDLRPFRTDLHRIDTGGLWIRSTDIATGHETGTVIVLTTGDTAQRLGPCDTDAMGAHARWLGSAALQERVQQWVSRLTMAQGSAPSANGPLAAGRWQVVRGVASADISDHHLTALNRSGWGITRSTEWTWRDGVRLAPPAISKRSLRSER